MTFIYLLCCLISTDLLQLTNNTEFADDLGADELDIAELTTVLKELVGAFYPQHPVLDSFLDPYIC